MREIEVSGIQDGTFIFTTTERDRAPWGTGNTTIFVPPEQLEGLVAKLQARLREIKQLQQATPAFSSGQQVRILGHFRGGQQGTVALVQQKDARMQETTGQVWSYTVAFQDGSTWAYNADELEPISRGQVEQR